MGNVKIKGLKELRELQKKIEKIPNGLLDEFMEGVAKELAARLLAKVVKRTPVGQYPKATGKKGGTLRRGWTEGKRVDAAVYAQSLSVQRRGKVYVVEIINPVEYASYVEFGHRTSNHKGWVKGKFMMTISKQELESEMPAIIENKVKKFLGECFS